MRLFFGGVGAPIVVRSLFDQALAHLLVVVPDLKGEKGVETNVGDHVR